MSLQQIRENILKGCGNCRANSMVKIKDLCRICQVKLSTLDLAEVSFAKQIEKEITEKIDKWVQCKNELSNTGVGLTNYGIDCRIDELRELKIKLTSQTVKGTTCVSHSTGVSE